MNTEQINIKITDLDLDSILEETDSSRELQLYLENDYHCWILFENYFKNLQQKLDKNIFDRDKAINGLDKFIIYSAKKYTIENCSKEDKYYQIFPKSDRKIIANNLIQYFLQEFKIGNRY